jgi:hypothetical protein
MRILTPRRLCIAAVLLAGLGVCWWVMYEPLPTVEFVGLQNLDERKCALFRVRSSLNRSYIYYGLHPSNPIHHFAVWDGKEWKDVGIAAPDKKPIEQELQANGEFTVTTHMLLPLRRGDSYKFAVDLTPADMDPSTPRSQQDGFVARFLNWLGVRRSGVITVWSDVVVVE